MWARMTDAELVAGSSLIVSGTLIGETQLRLASTDLHAGIVKVDAVHKGDRQTSIVVLALPAAPGAPGAQAARSSSDLTYRTGQAGLWFLRLRSAQEEGVYVADHPQRFTPADQAKAHLMALRALLPQR